MQHILITGCSSGIGYHTAKVLKDRFKIYATARDARDVEWLKNEGIWACVMDVDSNDSIDRGLSEVLEASEGRIDILFNNAGFGQPGAVEDISDSTLKEQFQTNFFGPHYLTRAVLKIMRAQKSGKIVYNSSILGFCAMPNRGAYNATKFAIEGLADTLRLELHGSNIFVSVIQPGPIDTKFRENALKKFLQNIDYKHSFHAPEYEKTLKRLEVEESETPFTLESDAVTKAFLHIINSKHPKAKYRVTFPTKLFWYLKRFLPIGWVDAIVRGIK